jgi:parallel beta-helix repeat protein
MTTRLLRTLLAAGILSLAGGTAARADETTWCNFFITTLPYTITTQGHYCFDRNLSTAITTGNAITVNSDFVTLDLNNFKLGGGSAGPGTQAVGVYANNHSNLTIRNGNIRGFAWGIRIDGSTVSSSQNIVIEQNTLDGNTLAGIAYFASAVTVRRNLVYNTGGSTLNPHPYCDFSMGISSINTCDPFVDYARSVEVVDNTVVNTFGKSGGNAANGITNHASSGLNLAVRNRVIGVPTASGAGISGGICRDNDVANSGPTGYFNCTLAGVNSDH